MRPRWEVLVGDTALLDHLAGQQDELGEHPLQEVVEELVAGLSELEQAVFYMRFGERAPHREIARRLGYRSHRIIQIVEEQIIEKVRLCLEQS